MDSRTHSLDKLNVASGNHAELNILTAEQQAKLRKVLEFGLPKVSQPYLAIAEQISAKEQDVIDQITYWQKNGLIRRFGLVVKHRKLGYNANAMVVWNIPNELVDKVAGVLASFDEVSLCYRRPRRLPDWPYNLFCMIHGTDRQVVLGQIEQIYQKLLTLFPSLPNIEKDILFSFKAYKQHGARYSKTSSSLNKKTESYKERAHG